MCDEVPGYRFLDDIFEFMNTGARDPSKRGEIIRMLIKATFELKGIDEVEKIIEELDKICEHPMFLHKIAYLRILMAGAFIRARLIDKAIKTLNEAIKIIEEKIPEGIKNNAPIIWDNLSGAYTNRGIAYSNLGDVDKALRDFSKAIEIKKKKVPKEFFDRRPVLYNDLASIYLNRGHIYKLRIEIEEAIRDYSEAIRIIEQEITEEAKNRFQAIWISLAEAYIARGGVYSIKGDLNKAVQDYSKAIKIINTRISKQVKDALPMVYKDLILAHAVRAYAYFLMGYIDKAVEDYSRAFLILEAHPELKDKSKPEYFDAVLTLYYSYAHFISSTTLPGSARIKRLIINALKGFEPSTADETLLYLLIFYILDILEALSKALDIILELHFSLKRIDVAKVFRDSSKKLLKLYLKS